MVVLKAGAVVAIPGAKAAINAAVVDATPIIPETKGLAAKGAIRVTDPAVNGVGDRRGSKRYAVVQPLNTSRRRKALT